MKHIKVNFAQDHILIKKDELHEDDLEALNDFMQSYQIDNYIHNLEYDLVAAFGNLQASSKNYDNGCMILRTVLDIEDDAPEPEPPNDSE